MDLAELLAHHVLGNTSGQQLSETACDLLAAGVDSHSLRLLAGERDPIMSDAHALLKSAAEELGFQFPATVERAAIIVAKYYAKRLLRGELTPVEAARKLWRDAFDPYLKQEGPTRDRIHSSIAPLMGYSDDLLSADTEEERRQFESDLTAAAEQLVREEAA